MQLVSDTCILLNKRPTMISLEEGRRRGRKAEQSIVSALIASPTAAEVEGKMLEKEMEARSDYFWTP